MRNAVRLSIAALLVVTPVSLVLAQAQPPPPPDLLMIYREEVRPGKGGAHEANEKAWAAAYAKAGAPITWLAMTSLTGPSEAWFISGMDSYADLQKMDDAFQASPALTAESQKFSAQESEILSRTSAIIASLQPELSYGPPVSIPEMRYMRVESSRCDRATVPTSARRGERWSPRTRRPA